jgi:NAD(P) transhydrogenase
MKEFDLVVIGAGPGGEKAAVKAAYFGYKVAIIEKQPRVGGAGVNTGTLPSKTLKETALYFSGRSDRGLYGVDRKFTRQTSIDDFMYRKDYVSTTESQEMLGNLTRHGVTVFNGRGVLEDAHTIRIEGEKEETIRGENILIATGSTPAHPPGIPFESDRIHDSDSILHIDHFPKSICVVGAGVIGCEYATIFATMGSSVYLVHQRDTVMPFLDKEITDSLLQNMRDNGTEVLLNTSVEAFEVPEDTTDPLRLPLSTGETLNVDMFLFAAGRQGNTAEIGLEEVGVSFSGRGIVEVNDEYQTSVPNIYAIGDCIGFPSLASTSMDQGRVAVSNIFNIGDIQQISGVFPYGVYTIPEVSTVGITEEEAKEQGLDYCIGRAFYEDLPRGKILGSKSGFMKLVFTRDDCVIRGVHIIGKIASELIHYGVSLVEQEKTLRQVVSTVFNYPTLHDLYKYASYDGLGNLSGHNIKKHAATVDMN